MSKICKDCLLELPLSSFAERTGEYKRLFLTKKLYRTQCKKCYYRRYADYFKKYKIEHRKSRSTEYKEFLKELDIILST